MDLPGAETGEGDGTAVAAPGRWLLVLAKKKTNGHTGFGLFSLLLPVFFSSLSLLLFFAFFFLFFSFHSREQKLLFSAFYLHIFGCFFLLFSLCFSLLFMLFLFAFLFLKASVETDQDDRCWSFCAQPMVAASGTAKQIGHAGFGLFVFSPSADAFSRDDEDDGDEGVLCWWSCRPCLCVFPCFRQCPSYGFLCLASLSFLLVFLFSFFSVLSFLFLFFFPPLGQQSRLLYSLYMALFRKQKLH